MVTRSIVGRFLILAILIVAVGVAAQTALILTDSGKKAAKTASVLPATPSKPADQEAPAAADAVRVVYPGPLGDVPASKPKLADAATASPLAGPAPQTTAKLALAMSAPAAGAPAPTIPAPAPTVPTPASTTPPASVAAAQSLGAPASPATPPDPAPAPLSPPASAQATPAQAAVDSHAKPPAPAPAGVEVASLGGGAPRADVSPAGGVNINTASVDAMNHLGGGHIGESIVKHRPYQSVEDLVKKRVLRRSVYNQIKDQLAAQ